MTILHLIAIDGKYFTERIRPLVQEAGYGLLTYSYYECFDPTKTNPEHYYMIGSGYWSGPERGPEYVCPILQMRVRESHIITGWAPERCIGFRPATVGTPDHPPPRSGPGLGNASWKT